MSENMSEQKKPDNMELLKQQSAACGPGCGCHAASPATSRIRWAIGIVVLAAAGVLVARAVVKEAGQPEAEAATGFATVVPPASENAGVAAANEFDPLGKELGALSELNTAASASDAVFVFLPGKDAAAGKPPAAEIQGAAKTLEAKGSKVALFTLKAGSADYDRVAAQMATPGVLALVKGRGMSTVSGEITQAKLVQAFVSASSAGGGCGPATPGCGPGTAGCGPRR